MRKILLLTMMMVFMVFKAQDDDIKKLSELVGIAKDNPAKKDSAIAEIRILKATTKSKIVEQYAQKAVDAFMELTDLEKTIVNSRDLSELSKDDLKNFKTNEDKFRSITFIHHKREGDFYPYLSIKNGVLNARLVAFYSKKDWIFFDKVILLSGGKTYTINFPDTKREVGSGYVYESGDIRISPELLNELKEIISNNDIEIRYSGERVFDRKLKNQEVITLREVIELYEKLKK
ncbi:hypothetical protein JSO62_07535 [Riemerella anatipestifer]|uniref:hypothetical protein n=1 Tax=Riemerella anatipestifer TaxID=34085 RepID=UPI0030BEB5CC